MTIIIDENSVFHKLPIELDEYQLLIFDSIRVTLQMIQYDYNSIENLLENIENSHHRKNDSIKIFSHVWGIIDKTQRLIKIYNKLPSKNHHKVLDKIKIIDKFRNTFQHLDERIDESLIKNRLPFYGTISWFNFENKEIKTKMIVSGITYGLKVQFTFPDIESYTEKVNDIILHAVDKKSYTNLNISNLIKDLIEFKNKNEKQLVKCFKEKNWKCSDWTARKDIFITLKSEKRKK